MSQVLFTYSMLWTRKQTDEDVEEAEPALKGERYKTGEKLFENRLEEFPIPISTPGFDNAPYFSAGNWVSKDPETGVYNVGNYRGMVKSRSRVGCDNRLPQHLRTQREKYKSGGHPFMPAAVVIGPTPNIGLVAVTKIRYDVSELEVAGGIAGEGIEMVRCKTIDLEVPATAEIVIEGQIPTDCLEREGPFGEYTGYIGREKMNLFLNITAITHRKNPIWNVFISQFPPSESSLMTRLGLQSAYYNFLKYDLSLGRLDLSGGTLGGSKIVKLSAAAGGVIVLPIDPAKFSQAKAKHPRALFGFDSVVLPPGESTGVINKKPTPVIDFKMVSFAHEDLPEEAVYTYVKTLLDNVARIKKMNRLFKRFSVDSAAPLIGVPYHGGAVKALKEKGLWTAAHEEQQRQLLK